MTARDEPIARRWLPGSADLVFAALAIVIVQGGRTSMLDDPGLGWHLRNLDAMLADGGWLTQDPFSLPMRERTAVWRTNQWLGELPLWLGWRWAGEEGIAVVTALVLAFTLRCLYGMMLADGVPWPTAVLWTALAALGTSPSWVARPNICSLVYLIFVTRACVLFHEGRMTAVRLLWLCPLFVVWANTHGGFLAGLAVLAITVATEALIALGATTAEDRTAATRRCLQLLVVAVACGLATLLNPYGLDLYRWTLQLLGDAYFMNLNQEWKPPPFRVPGSFRYELLLLLFPAVLAVSRRRPCLVELTLAIVFLHLALTGFRYVALWVVIVVPLLARCSLEIPWLQALGRRLGLTGEGATFFRSSPVRQPWLWSLAAALGMLFLAKVGEGGFVRHNQRIVATTALQRLLEIHRTHPTARVFNPPDWGGYLTWHGWPALLTWIDDRNEAHGRDHYERTFAILRAEPGWQEQLRNAGIDLVVVHVVEPLAEALRADGWHEVYRDDFAVIYLRNQLPGNSPRN